MELPVAAKDSCRKCVRKVTARQDALQCDICNNWWHRICGTSPSHAAYTEISKHKQIRRGIPYDWTCEGCTVQVATPVTESTRIDCIDCTTGPHKSECYIILNQRGWAQIGL